MEIKIPKEVRAHKETIFFGLTMRQFLCSVLAVAMAVGVYFLLKNLAGLESCWYAIVPADRIMLSLPSFPCPALPPWAGRTFLTDRRRAMTEYEKLITAEQIAHTVEITECLTGKTGMANTCAGRVALFYGAEDGNDDKIVTPRTFSRQFKITAAILG